MKISIVLLLLSLSTAFGQHTLPVLITDQVRHEPLPGANLTVPILKRGASTNAGGLGLLTNLPAGAYQLQVTLVGFRTKLVPITVPATDTVRISLETSIEELEEVFVTSTRTGRAIADEPTRIEVVDSEELDEKANMQPGNISVLLKESPGIQVQQTSVTSANATFRIQGLDGRYTQLLQDGLPLYSGFASGLSLMQIPPLNLRQVEILKGYSAPQ